jgi:hypothetical protein
MKIPRRRLLKLSFRSSAQTSMVSAVSVVMRWRASMDGRVTPQVA